MNSNEEVRKYMADAPDEQQQILIELRNLVEATVPDVVESFKWKRPVYSLQKAFCYLQKNKKHINFGFMNGDQLEDPEQLLEGSGKSMQHIKIRKIEDIRKDYFTHLLNQAARLV